MNNDFKSTLLAYQQLLDDDIAHYCNQLIKQVDTTYGGSSFLVTSAYTDILKRGGKRLRGTLTMVGYEMCGGTNRAMILDAARAVEMMHAYILIIDDIQDRSALRRGGPSAHALLKTAHTEQKWRGDAAHTGTSLAMSAALLGLHNAQIILANLDADPELRLKAVTIMNHTMAVTNHGQIHDIINEINPKRVTLTDVKNVLQWKTAHYSVLNPIHIGMVLAGAPCEDTNGITEYALHAGKAFQIVDDLQVVGEGETGKTASDDIREGKQTLLTVYVSQHASAKDAAFLASCLGKQDLTEKEFKKCRAILIESGAADYAQKIAESHIKLARDSLAQHADRWTPQTVQFLDGLANYILTRSS
jgi:geranylgeranyl diphosphate synthase type I